MSLSIRDLTVCYIGERAAVDGVSLDVAQGEIVALVGESGCGKTSVVKTLLGLLPASATVAGSVEFDGDELIGRSDWRGIRGARIAIVPQGAMSGLSPVHRVGAQLVEMLRLHTDLPPDAVRRRVAELIARVRLSPGLLRVYPHELSGGMRQRVAIALALAGDPGLLVADEPTTGLDALTQRHILELLTTIAREASMSMLVVSHDLAGLTPYADRAAVMYAGRLAEVRRSGAAHPYTVGLLTATPSPDPGRPWTSVPGAAPPPGEAPPGCRFAARCPLVIERCRSEEPPLQPYGEGLVACHRAGKDVSYPAVPRPAGIDGGPIVRAAGLGHTFRGRRRSVVALRDVDLQIASGEIVGLVGESGSGKSTLARILLGLIRPSQGRVQLNGVELTALRGHRLRREQRRIGFVHQDPYDALHPGMRVAALVAEPLVIAAVTGPERDTAVRTALADAGLPAGEEFLNRYPSSLSGGQRQRVAIARALVSRPILLVADEATSMLDVSTRGGIATTLRRLAHERGLAVLFVTHDVGEAVQSCDRIMVLRYGQIVEQGESAEIALRPVHDYTAELLSAFGVR